ncbi:MAG: hypothetical protein AB3N06_06055 [Erythrobacter sp.]
MEIDPEIEALRGDHAAQRRMRKMVARAIENCRKEPSLAPVLADLASYGAGADLETCPDLNRFVTKPGAAQVGISRLLGHLLDFHRENPLAQLGFRHQSRAGFHYLQLAGKGRATLGLALHDRDADLGTAAVGTFSDADRHEIVLAGRARLELLDIVEDHGDRVQIDCTASSVTAGDRLCFRGPAQSRVMRKVSGRLLVLRLARIASCPEPTRQFDLASGKLLHRASGDRRESRHEMMMAVLGRMGRAEAAPVLAELARSGSDHLRWQALRECLALESGTGFAALARVAGEPGDPLASAAAALRASLVEAYPQFRQEEHTPCPA